LAEVQGGTFVSPGVKVIIEGDKLAAALSGDTGALATNILKLCTQIEGRAKGLCPVDTGRLRSSITSGLIEDGDTIAGVVGTDVEYAPYVELGTIRMDARPFLVPAAYAILGSGV